MERGKVKKKKSAGGHVTHNIIHTVTGKKNFFSIIFKMISYDFFIFVLIFIK